MPRGRRKLSVVLSDEEAASQQQLTVTNETSNFDPVISDEPELSSAYSKKVRLEQDSQPRLRLAKTKALNTAGGLPVIYTLKVDQLTYLNSLADCRQGISQTGWFCSFESSNSSEGCQR